MNRQQKTEKAALQAAVVTSQLVELSKRERWQDAKKVDLETAFLELGTLIRALDPMFAAPLVDAELDIEVQPVQINTVFIPFTREIGPTSGGATNFDAPNFVGGYRKGGIKRENGHRCIPNSVITVPYDQQIGVVGVKRRWLFGADNADLLVYTSSFPKSVTKL